MPKTRPRRAAPAPEIRHPKGTTEERCAEYRRQIARLCAQLVAEAEACGCPARLYDLRAALRDWVDDAPIFLDVEDGAAR